MTLEERLTQNLAAIALPADSNTALRICLDYVNINILIFDVPNNKTTGYVKDTGISVL